MGLDTAFNLIQILAQPLILEPNAGITIALGLRFIDQRFDGLQFMDNAGQRFALGIGVRIHCRRDRKTKNETDYLPEVA